MYKVAEDRRMGLRIVHKVFANLSVCTCSHAFRCPMRGLAYRYRYLQLITSLGNDHVTKMISIYLDFSRLLTNHKI